jgi:hypothetical protein
MKHTCSYFNNDKISINYIKENNEKKVKWIIGYIRMIFPIIIIIHSLQIYMSIERKSVVVYVFVAQCHFSLSLSLLPLLSTICYVHAMLASQKEREE